MIPKVPLGHLSVTPGTRSEILEAVVAASRRGDQTTCIPINVTKYGMSKRDPRLTEAINGAGLVIADGMPVRWLARRHGINGVTRITGIEFAESILELSVQYGWKAFFFGANEASMTKAVANQEKKYPGLRVVGCRNGYYMAKELPGIVADIRDRATDVLLLGLGLPQKEFFIEEHGQEVNASIILAVGGAFDVWADVKARAPLLLQRYGLEWLYRSVYDVRKATTLARHFSVFLGDYVRGSRGGLPGQDGI